MEPLARNPQRFGILLSSLVLLFAGSGLLDYASPYIGRQLIELAVRLLLAAVLVGAVVSVGAGPRSWVAWSIKGLVGAFFIIEATAVLFDSPGLGVLSSTLALVGVGLTVVLIVDFLLRSTVVGRDTLSAALCAYILMAVAWALLYRLLGQLEPGSFQAGGQPAPGFGPGDLLDEMYFSVVALTTLGFGDITPSTTAARIAVALEALTGQVFLVVLVARLVGLNVSQSLESGEEKHAGRNDD